MDIEAGLSLEDFLVQYYHSELRAAVAINHCVIPRQTFRQTRLNHEDNILLIIPMQGG